jgi:iron complex outermembrane receptor protein
MKNCIFLLTLSLSLSASQNAVASCGAASCPLNNHRYLKSGSFQLGPAHEYLSRDQVCFCSSDSFTAEFPTHQNEVQTLNDRDSVNQSGGQHTRPPVQLQEITVTASPNHRANPLSTITVSPVAIRQTVSTDSWDLLRQTAGLEIHEQGQGPGFASDASIRGFSSDHSTDIALWVDGVPVNEPVNGHAEGYNDFSLLFPELIKNIEVIKGPVSPLYGNFALAGTVNIVTPDRVDNTAAWLSGGSNGRANGTIVTGFDNENWRGVLGVRGERDGGWRPNSKWDLGQVYGRVVQDFSDALTVDGGIGLYASRWDSPGFLTVDQFEQHLYNNVTNTTDGGFKRRAQERLSLRYFLAPTMLWRSTLYATQGRWQLFLTIPPEPGAGEGSGRQTEEEDLRHGYGLTSALTLPIPTGDLTFGIEGRYDHSDYQNWFTTSRVRDSAQTLVSAHQLSGALFLQVNMKIFDRLDLMIGGRYDGLKTQSEPEDGLSLTGSKATLSPKVGASYQILPSANLYANVSKGFRETDGVITDPSLPLITAWNYEAGVKVRNERLALDLALFGMDVTNEQTFDPVTLTSTSNGASRRQGVDVTLNVQATEAVRVASTWTFTDGKYEHLITEDGDTLSGSQIYNTAKYVGTLALEVSPQGTIWQFRIGSNFTGPYAPFDEPGVLLPSYAVFYVSAELHYANVLIDLGLRNLFDKAYPELRAGGFVEPGQPRSACATLKYTF